MSTTTNLKPRSRVKVKVNCCQNKILLDTCIGFFFELTSVRTPLPRPTFNLALLERCAGTTPDHPSNSPKVSQVSSTTGTPLDSIFLYRSETWSHKPESQATGLGSFRANAVSSQKDLRKSLVDIQCFSKGLWTKTMANHVKPENLQGDLRH